MMQDIQQVQSALAYIPADDRDTWLRMGMAVKSELGDAGFPIWDEWSQGDESYKERDAKSVWRSAKAGGGIGIGTLYHEAKQYGWKPTNTGQRPDPADMARQRREREQRDVATASILEADRDHARQLTLKVLQNARRAPTANAYAIRKGITPAEAYEATQAASHECRRDGKPEQFTVNKGDLIVPVYVNRKPFNIQVIRPDGTKLFLTGGKTKAGYLRIGQPSERIYICEGYATGRSIHEATGACVVVAFNAGNIAPVMRWLAEAYPKAEYVIAADNDAGNICKRHKDEGATAAVCPLTERPDWCKCNPGLTAGTNAARELGSLIAYPNIAGGKDWNDVHKLKGLDAVRAQIGNAATVTPDLRVEAISRPEQTRAISTISTISIAPADSEPEVMPLQREMPETTPFPIKALGDVLGGAVLKCSEVIQAPLAISANSILAAATLAVQGHANCVIDGRRFPLSGFFVTIGESGERKSEVDKNALWPHRKHQTNLRQQYELDYADYKRADEAYERAKSDALSERKKSAGASVATSFADKKRLLDELAAEEPQRPLEPLMICEEPTYEGLVKMLAVGQPSVGLFSDEGGRFIGGHGMNADNLLKTAAGLSGAWDGKPISRVRSGDGAAEYPGRRVSFHLMMQPEISQSMLSNPVLMAQGLLSRCLVTWPQSTAGTRQYRAIDLSQSAELKRYSARMLAILEAPLPVAEGARNELVPRDLPLDPQAKTAWVAFHDHIETQIAEGGQLAPIKGLANKAPEHAARLAGVLALVDDLNATSISLQCIRAGIELTTHYINEALRLFAAGACDPHIINAEKLMNWLRGRRDKDGNPDRYVSLVEVYQMGPVKSLRSAKPARELMRTLIEHGQIAEYPAGVEYAGTHRREAYKVNV